MQFKVPQFLDIEDTIFGPFTFRQFVYLAGGGGMCFVLYKLLGLFWGALPILFVGGLACALTFYRPNGKPFIDMIQAAMMYLLQSKLYIWKRRLVKDVEKKKKVDEEIVQAEAKLTPDKLKDLAWSLDILDSKKERGN